eukprot:m.222938 g.222938  ORF g.222938 m.222938 type:complete len:804 (+) comp16138_c0_seq1:242-2653(+)
MCVDNLLLLLVCLEELGCVVVLALLAARCNEGHGVRGHNLVLVVVSHQLIERGEQLAVANHQILAVRGLINHVVLDAPTLLHAVGEGVAEAGLGDAHEEGASSGGAQQLLGLLAGDDAVEPLLKVALALHTSTLLHLHFLEPAHGCGAADTTLLLDLLLDALGKLLHVRVLGVLNVSLLEVVVGTSIVGLHKRLQHRHHIGGGLVDLCDEGLHHGALLGSLVLGPRMLAARNHTTRHLLHGGGRGGVRAQSIVELVLVEVAHEDLALADLVALNVGLLHDLAAGLVRGRRVGRQPVAQQLVPLDKVGKGGTIGITLFTDAGGLKHTSVAQLLGDQLAVKRVGDLLHVGLDATHKVRRRLAHLHHELLQRDLKGGADSGALGLLLLLGDLLDTLAHLLLDVGGVGLGAGLGILLCVLCVLVVGAKQLAHQRVLAETEDGDDIHGQRVAVLLQKALGIVRHPAGVVVDGKLVGIALGTLVVLAVLREVLVQLLHHRRVGTFREESLLIADGEQTNGLAEHHVQQRLVVLEADLAAVNALACVLVELHLEDVVVEKVLQLFVGKVDEKLLQAVVLEALKAENVEDTNGLLAGLELLLLGAKHVIALAHNVGEDTAIEGLGSGVTHILRLDGLVLLDHRVVAHDGDGSGEGLLHGANLGTQLVAELLQQIIGAHNGRGLIATKLHVAHVQNAGNEVEDVLNLLLGKADNGHAVDELLVHLLEESRADLGQGTGIARQETMVAGVANLVLGLVVALEASEEEVKHVKVLLTRTLLHHTRLLQQILVHQHTRDAVAGVKAQLDKLAKAA